MLLVGTVDVVNVYRPVYYRPYKTLVAIQKGSKQTEAKTKIQIQRQ